MNSVKPLVSIIIPVLNEENNIRPCLEAISRQTYPRFEVLIADNGSKDRTLEIARAFDFVKIVQDLRRGISYAKNTAAKQASGDYIVTTDADCIPDPDWISKLLECFENPQVGAAGGLNTTPEDSTDFEKCVDLFLYVLSGASGSRYIQHDSRITETKHNPGCNAAYRTSVFRQAGGFNEAMLTVEDEELDYRILKQGCKILFTPHAKVFHKRRSTLPAFYKQMFRYAIGRVQFFKSFPQKEQMVRFLPLLSVPLWLGSSAVAAAYGSAAAGLAWLVFSPMFFFLSAGCWLAAKSEMRFLPQMVKITANFWAAWAAGTAIGLFYKAKPEGHTY